MGIFDRLRQPKTAVKTPTESVADVAKKEEASLKKMNAITSSTAGGSQPEGIGGNAPLLLATPWVSEKAAILASRGTYVFRVPITANKIEIQKAVEKLYVVKVEQVRTVRGQGKIMKRGRIRGRRNQWKKALVTLKEGQKIDLYQGV